MGGESLSAGELTRFQAILDVGAFIAFSVAVYGCEEWLRSAGLFPFPDAFDGAPTLIASFFLIVGIMKWRGQGWRDFGLIRPRRWWWIPAWGVLVLVVNLVSQNTIVPLLSLWFELDPPDFSRYDMVRDNLGMLLVMTAGAMVTGGFMEEFVYRGMMIDRLGTLFGGGRKGLWAAALLNGLPFGIIHFEWGIGGVVLTTVMGSVLGLMYLATGRNLWPLVFAHASLDALLLTGLYLGVIG